MSKPSYEGLMERAKDERAAFVSRLLAGLANSLKARLRRLTMLAHASSVENRVPSRIHRSTPPGNVE